MRLNLLVEFINHHPSIKNTMDVAAATAGVTLPVAFWLNKLVNPFITAIVGLATLVWILIRIWETDTIKRWTGRD